MPGSSGGFMKHGRAQAAERKEMARRDVDVEHRAYAKAVGIKAKKNMSLAEAVAHDIHEHRGEYLAFQTASADKKAARMWKDYMKAEHARGPSVAKVRPPKRSTPLKASSDDYVPF